MPVHITFRLRQPRRLYFAGIGFAVGAALAIPLWRPVGWRLIVPLVALLTLAGWVASMVFVRDQCIERNCGAVLPRGAKSCPRCGGAIVGVVALAGKEAD